MPGAHVIESLQFDVAFDTAEEAFAQQARLGSFAHGLALEVIERVFDDLAPAGRIWRLDKLDVRLSPLPMHEPDSAWAERLEIGLREALGQGTAEARVRAAGLAPGPESGHAEREQNASVLAAMPSAADRPSAWHAAERAAMGPVLPPDLEPLWYWLHHGHLPWHCDGRPADAVDTLWQQLAPDRQQALQRAVHAAPQRALLQRRWSAQGLPEGPRPDAVRPLPADARPTGPDEAAARGSDGWPEHLAQLRRNDPGPAVWAERLGAMTPSQRRQWAERLVPRAQLGFVEAVAESLPWRRATQGLWPGRSAAQCQAALWGCALGAALQAGEGGFDPQDWLVLALRRWSHLMPGDHAGPALARELDHAQPAGGLPSVAWQALREAAAGLVATSRRPAFGPASAVATHPEAGSTRSGTSVSGPDAASDPVAAPLRVEPSEVGSPLAGAATLPPTVADEWVTVPPSAAALAAWRAVVVALDAESSDLPGGHPAARQDLHRMGTRSVLEAALAGAELPADPAVWSRAARDDRRWLMSRLRQQGRRQVWRRSLARSMHEAQVAMLLRLWADDAMVVRLMALLATAERWSLESRRQPPSWPLLLREWLLGHLLAGGEAAFDLRACLAHLLQQRARWDGLTVHAVALGLAGACVTAQGTAQGAPLEAAHDGDPERPGPDPFVQADDERLPGVQDRIEAALQRLATQAAAVMDEDTRRPDGGAGRAAHADGSEAPALLALRARLDEALARAEPVAAGDAWATLCCDDRAWLASRLRHHGRSAAWRQAWAEANERPWQDLLSLWLLPAEVAAVEAALPSRAPQPAGQRPGLASASPEHGGPLRDAPPSPDAPSRWAALPVQQRRAVLDCLLAASGSTPTEPGGEPDPADATAAAAVAAERVVHAEAPSGDLDAWLRPALIEIAAAPSARAASGAPPSLVHLEQRDRLAAMMAAPEAAARQVELLDDAGRRQLLHVLRPDAAAPALATLELLVLARAEARLTAPAAGGDALGREDWCFLLCELVEEDRAFDAAGLARRWWAACGSADASGTAAAATSSPASAGQAPRAGGPPGLMPARAGVVQALSRLGQPAPGVAVGAEAGLAPASTPSPSPSPPSWPSASSSPRALLAQQLQAGLAEPDTSSDDHDVGVGADAGADAGVDAHAPGAPAPPSAAERAGAPVLPDGPSSFVPPWPDAPGSAALPPWASGGGPAAPNPDETMYVHNAGLVLLGPYLPMLFKRLGLTEDQAFKDEASAERALHLLQFLCDGSSQPAEHLLLLPKLLCGLDPALPVQRELLLNDDEQAACTSLLEAVIAHWRALGKTSVAGLQETFLQREGALTLLDDEWSLTVESKAFDILIDQLPWGFSTCRFPWMTKVLHVHWR